jgi:hypothetical protein
MKYLICIFSLILACNLTFAAQITENTAKIVGQNFLSAQTNSQAFKNGNSLVLVYTATENKINALKIKPTVYYYIFNESPSEGFVIVAADDNVSPILGYSDENNFNPSNIPISIAEWLNGYKEQISDVIKKNIQANTQVKTQWKEYLSGNISSLSAKTSSSVVLPLVQTQWDQSPYYNALCPYDIVAAEYTVTGCTATAMSQIMKYWNYPSLGMGSHSYTDKNYGIQKADFGNTFDYL